MLLRIFKANHIFNIILLPVLGFLLLLGSILKGGVFPVEGCQYTTPVCFPLMNSGIPYWGAILLNYALVMLISFILLQINARFAFVKERTFLPGFIFILIIYAIPDLRVIQPAFISGVFIVLSILSIFSSFDKRSAIRPAFDAGLLIGLSGIFYILSNFFIILIPIGIFILRNKLNWRETIAPFVGLSIPWIFTLSYYFIIDKTDHLFTLIQNSFIPKDKGFIEALPIQVYIIFLMLLLTVSSIFILRQFGLKNISIRRYFKVLFLYYITAFLLMFLPPVSVEILVFMTIPLTFLLTNYLIFAKRKFWAEIFLTILLIFAFALQFFVE